MEAKKTEILEELDKVTGGTDTTESTETATVDPFAALPRVDNNSYTTDITNRA